MGEVGQLSKVRLNSETTYGGGGTGSNIDFAVDSIDGPGFNRERVDHPKISGSFANVYAFHGVKSFNRSFPIEVNSDNYGALDDIGLNRTSNVHTSYEISEYDAGGQYYKARGCKCNSLVLNWESGGELIATLDMIGNGDIQSLGTADAVSTFAPDDYISNPPFMIASFSIAGNTTYDVTGCQITINNNLIVGPMNASYYAKSLSERSQQYEWQITMDNPNDTTFLNNINNNTGTKITATATFSDPAGNTLTIASQNCIITDPAPSGITADELATITMTLTPTGTQNLFSWTAA